MRTEGITMDEVTWAVKRLKQSKAPGPDEVPVDSNKETSKAHLELILHLLNYWWNGKWIKQAATRAEVILLVKDKNNLANYRPISFLDTKYNIYTSIIQQHDYRADRTHIYNWCNTDSEKERKEHCTSITLCQTSYWKRRKHENNNAFCIVRLGKAFDKVIHEEFLRAITRMNVPQTNGGLYCRQTCIDN